MDLIRSSPVLYSLATGHDPEWRGWVTAQRRVDDKIRLRFPNPDSRRGPTLTSPDFKLRNTAKKSYFLHWVAAKLRLLVRRGDSERFRRRPCCGDLPGEWHPTGNLLHREHLQRSIYHSSFSRTRWNSRPLPWISSRRAGSGDGASLVTLASHRMKVLGKHLFDRMYVLAEIRGIPVIDQYDHILRQGAEPREAEWTHDQHWNPTGHRWARKRCSIISEVTQRFAA